MATNTKDFDFNGILDNMGLTQIDTTNLVGDARARAEYYNEAVDLLRDLNNKVQENEGTLKLVREANEGVLKGGKAVEEGDLQDLRALVTVLNSLSSNMDKVIAVSDTLQKSKISKENEEIAMRNHLFEEEGQIELISLLKRYRTYLSEEMKQYDLSNSKKYMIGQLTGLKKLGGEQLQEEAKQLVKECIEIINNNKGTKTPGVGQRPNTFSTFYSKKDMGKITQAAKKIVHQIPAMSTAQRQKLSGNPEATAEQLKSKFYKGGVGSTFKPTPMIKTGNIITRTEGKTITNPTSNNISASDYVKAYQQIIKDIDSKTTQGFRQIQAASTQEAVDQLDAAQKFVFIDFENNYEKEGKHAYNNTTHAPVTVGISHNGKDRFEGLIVGDADTTQRIVTFLTDAKLGRSREILADTLGLGGAHAGANGKIYYNTTQGTEISQAELEDYIQEYVDSSIKPGEVKAAVAAQMNRFGYMTKDYNVITTEGIQKEVEGHQVWGANTPHDIGLYNSRADKQHQIKEEETGDIFKFIEKEFHFASGYDVTALARLLLSPDEFDAAEAHGAGSDAYIEALILAKYKANQAACDQIIKEFESQLEAGYKQIHPNKDIRTYDSNKQRWKYTEDYKNYHGQMLSLYSASMVPGSKVLDGASPAALEALTKAQEERSTFVDRLSKEIETHLSAGHREYAEGKVARGRIANATGRTEGEVNTNSILEKADNFVEEMYRLGYYVDTQVVNDKGVGKLHFRVMPLSQYNFNPDLINDENYATVFDMTLADGNSQIDANNQNSIATLGWDYYTNDLKDSVYTSASNMMDEALRLAKANYKNNQGETITAAEASSTIKWAGKEKGRYGSVDATGKLVSEEVNKKTPNEFEKDRLQNSFYINQFVGDSMRNDGDLLDLIIETKKKANGKISAKAIDPFNLDSNMVASFAEAIEVLMNMSAEEQEEYTRGIEATGLDVSKDLVYLLLTSELGEKFRRKVADAKEKGLGGHLTGLSSGNVKAGRMGTKEFMSSAFQGLIGQDYAEGWVKTQSIGKNLKIKSVEELLASGFWKRNAFATSDKDKQTSADVMVNAGSIPKEVIDKFYELTGEEKLSSDDQMLMARDFANTAEGLGADKWSEGITSEETFKYLEDLGIDIEALKKGVAGDIQPLLTDALSRELTINENFRIPVGAVLTGIRLGQNGGIEVQYRQPDKVTNATKLTGLTARMQASVSNISTDDLRVKLHEATQKAYEEKENNLNSQLSLVESNLNATTDTAEFNRLSEEKQALLKALEEIANLKEITNQVIDMNTVFREAPDMKRQADMRVNPQYVAAAYQNLIPDVDTFNTLAESLPILKDFFEVVGEGENARIAQVKDFDWSKYNLSEAALNIKMSDGRQAQTAEDISAYVHSMSADWGLLAEIAKQAYSDDKNTITALLSSGALQFDPRGASNFVNSAHMGGVFGQEATDVNESANFRGTIALLRRTQEELELAKSELIKRFGGGAAGEEAYNQFFNEMLQSLIVRDQAAVDKANSILTAAEGNYSKENYKAIMNQAKADNSKIMTIGFSGKKNTDSYVDISTLDFSKRPENKKSFTADEFKGTGLDVLYSNFGDAIGDGKSVIKLDLSGLNDEQKAKLSAHGIDSNMLIGLSKLVTDKEGNVNYEEEQRALAKLIENVQDILADKEVKDNYVATTYQNTLANMQKPLVQAAISARAANSGYLHTGKSSLDYNWVSEGTARGMMSIDREASSESLKEYITILMEDLGKTEKQIEKATSGDKVALLKQADKALDEYMKALLGMTDEEQMKKFNMLATRSPFLTAYSAVMKNTVVRGDEDLRNRGLDPESYKDVIHLSEKSAALLKADWDGDIIGAKIMLQRTTDDNFKAYLEKFIEYRTQVIDNGMKILGEIDPKGDAPEWDMKKYQAKLIENSKTLTDLSTIFGLKHITLSGNKFVGMNNYTDEQTRGAISWYRNNKMGDNHQYNEFDLATELYKTMQTQLGQQVGISAKQMGSLLLNDSGQIAFTADTAGQVFRSMDEETRKEHGWTDEAQFAEQFRDMFHKSIVNTFGAMNLGEALTAMESQGIDPNGDSSFAQFYRTMKELMSAGSDKFDVTKFFQTLNGAEGMTEMFKAIYGEGGRENYDAIMGYINSDEYKEMTGLERTRVFRKSDDIDPEQLKENVMRASAYERYAQVASETGQKVSMVSQQLAQIIGLIQQIINNGIGVGSNNNKDYVPNKSWQESLEKAKNAKITSTKNAKTELYTGEGRHDYINTRGSVARENGKVAHIYSATSIGSSLLGSLSESDKAQMRYYQNELQAGRNVNSGINFKQWELKGFKTNKYNLPFSMVASSLAGNMYHRANEMAVNLAQNGGPGLSALAENPELIGYQNDEEYKNYFSQLVMLFNGSEELANAYLKSRGEIRENLQAGLAKLKEAGVSDDASNVKTEESLITKMTAIFDGKKEMFNISATLDNIVRDTETGGFTSVDLKQKETSGSMSPADVIEGVIQHYLLTVKASDKNWLMEHGVAPEEAKDDEKRAAIVEATRNSFTKFLKVSNGEAVLKSTNLYKDGMSVEQIVYAMMSELMKGGHLNWKDLPIQQIYAEDYESLDNPSFDEYKDQYKEKLKTELEISKLQNNTTGLTLEQQTEQDELLAALQQRLGIINQILDATDKEKFTEEQLNELEILRTKNNIAISNAKNKRNATFGTGMGAQFANSLNKRIENFFEFGMVQKVLNKITQSIRQVIQYTEKLDACLVDIRIATGYSINQTRDLLKEYNNLASQVGKTTEEVAKAANDWLRAGYEGAEATELVTASMYLSTLGMMESSAATEALISVLKGWKLESDEVIGVVDKLVTVDMNAAVNNSRNI